jgi:branched-chain amino acid transport system substrate-binding protein
MRKGITKGAVVATTALAALTMAACTTSSKGTEASSPAGSSGSATAGGIPAGPITIGMPIALSGPINLYDGDMLVGAKAEAAAINKAGGVDGHMIKIVTADTKSDIAQGGAAALQVIQQGAQFIIPTLDYNFGGGAARTAMSHHLIAISAASDPRFGLSIGPSMFNLYGGSPNESSVLAAFAKSKGYKTVYELEDTSTAVDSSDCNDFKEVAPKLGIKVDSGETFGQADTSIATQVTAIRSAQSKISAILLCSYPPGGSSALRQLRAGGITVPVLLTQPFDGNAWEAGVPNMGQVYIASLGVITAGEDKDPTTAAVFEAASKYSGKPNVFSQGILTGWSAVQAIADAVKATNSVNTQKITQLFESWKNQPLGIGDTTWTSSCHVAAPRAMQIATVANNQEQYLTTITPSVLPAKSC